MGRWLCWGITAGILCGCAVHKGIPDQAPEGYTFHRLENDDLVIHWNVLEQEVGIVAEGYVESVGSPGILIRFVNLTLQGLDAEGRVVSKAPGVPHRDIFLAGDQGLFRIAMPVTGQEIAFLVRADYWWQPFDDSEKRKSMFGW